MFPREGEEAPRIPVILMRCECCALLQLRDTTNPTLMYREGYGYKSGINQAMVGHLRDVVRWLRPYVSPGDAVLDIGCNDGTLLKHWAPFGVERFGYDPIGEDVGGCHVVRDYFKAHGRKYRVITSLAMFYDLENPVAFAKDIAASLTDDGVWAVEVGYAGAVHAGHWDGICHEHLTYWGLSQIAIAAWEAGLSVIFHRFTPTNGGSLFVLLGRAPVTMAHAAINDMAATMQAEGAWDWSDYARRVDASAMAIASIVGCYRTVDVLGASTKGNAILQTAGLDRSRIRRAIERNPDKIGRRTPGTDIPIAGEDALRADPPDAMLVLPYHFREGILARYADLRARGVAMIFPLPVVEVV